MVFPEVGPPKLPAARLVETHVSWVWLVGEHAFKIKKPVHLDFVDWRTVAARQAACRSEVVLNRRLSPDVYEGVGSFQYPDGRREPVVVMRRLPAERALSEMIATGTAGIESCVRSVADMLAVFHRTARRGADVDRDCAPDRVAELWVRNLSAIRSADGGPVSATELSVLEGMADRYIRGRETLFYDRVRAGRAVDGHGDLLCDDIFCLPDGPRVMDCLEFDPALRHGDVAADLAFLAMDLSHRGRPDLAAVLVQRYHSRSGDQWPGTFTDFWMAYRAVVRAKVAAIRAATVAGPGSEADRREAATLVSEALRHLRRAQVRVVLVGGLPGSGKSTLAGGLGRETGWPVYSSDQIRRCRDGPETDHYSPSAVLANYEALVARAGEQVVRGQSVILDATWSRRGFRRLAERMAEAASADLVAIECKVDHDVARSRIERRGPGSSSEATPDLVESMAARWEPWPGARQLDTAGAEAVTLRAALCAGTISTGRGDCSAT